MFFEMLRKMVFLQHVDEFDGEDEGGVGWDVGAGTALSIGEVVGDVELEDGAFFHKLHTFGPAGDDLTQAELGGHTAAVAGVEDGAVDEGAIIVAAYGVAGFGLSAGALLYDLVLEAAGGGGDFGAQLVAVEESFAFAFSGFSAFGGFIGGNVLGWLGIHWGGTLVGQIVTAVIGAVILLWVISLIKKK
jgi:hypothetical protein